MRIHKEGYRIIAISFVIIGLVVGLILYFNDLCVLSIISCAVGLALFLLITNFFRSPNRSPKIDEDSVIAVADGTIVIVDEVYEPEYLKEKCIQVSIFMSIFNVHVNWFPIGGVVEYFKYHPGKYLVAWHPKSSEKNERTSIVVRHAHGHKVLFRQIAGYLARRVVCYAKEGTSVEQGNQTGFIKFGSRIDLFLPLGSDIMVEVGDKVKGRQTVIAELPVMGKDTGHTEKE